MQVRRSNPKVAQGAASVIGLGEQHIRVTDLFIQQEYAHLGSQNGFQERDVIERVWKLFRRYLLRFISFASQNIHQGIGGLRDGWSAGRNQCHGPVAIFSPSLCATFLKRSTECTNRIDVAEPV